MTMAMAERPVESGDQAVRRQMQMFAASVDPHVGAKDHFALLDVPEHGNIGDSAIYAGELAFFDRHVEHRPHVVLDNSYGKISRYIDAFGQDDLTTRVSSLDELQKVLAP